jgi:hypothetical protein
VRAGQLWQGAAGVPEAGRKVAAGAGPSLRAARCPAPPPALPPPPTPPSRGSKSAAESPGPSTAARSLPSRCPASGTAAWESQLDREGYFGAPGTGKRALSSVGALEWGRGQAKLKTWLTPGPRRSHGAQRSRPGGGAPTCALLANIWRGLGNVLRSFLLELKQNKEGFGCGSHALQSEQPN